MGQNVTKISDLKREVMVQLSDPTLGPGYNEFGYNDAQVQQVDFCARKSLAAILQSSVTMSKCLQ